MNEETKLPKTDGEITGEAEGRCAPASGSAKFVLQRPEYPDWFAGWNQWNLPSWTSCYDDACFVRHDDLVDTMTRLSKHKPVASLHSPNDKLTP